MASTIEHQFYCIKCGKRGIPLARKRGAQREKYHRKKLFCLNCQQEVNHVECRNQEEIDQFKIWFEEGMFKDEAEESISYVRAGWIGQNDLDKKANRNGELSMPAYLS